MIYSVTVEATGSSRRLLVGPWPCASVRAARAWLARNVITWRDVLLRTESHVVGCIVDDEGQPVAAIEYARGEGLEPVEHDRDALRGMRRRRTSTKGKG